MAAPIKWRSKIILAKIETEYGTDSVPTGAADAMLMQNVELRPMEGEDISRNLERPFSGPQEDFPVGLRVMLTGSVEMVGSGSTGVAPAWAPLMRSCAAAEVVTADDDPGDGTVEYTPISESQESCSIYFFVGGTRHVIVGARGSFEMTVGAQGIPQLRFSLTGLFGVPSEQTRPTPDLSNFAIPQAATSANTPTFTIDAVPLVLREFTFNRANDVQPRLLIGRETIEIVDSNERLSATVEAVPLTTFDPFTLANDRDRVVLALAHGTEAGRRVAFDAPICTVQRLTGYQQNQQILEWPLSLVPLPDTGDDQWTLTLT